MKVRTDIQTLQQIRLTGLEVLARELGPVGMTRFLQQFEGGRGDYTEERHAWLPQNHVREVADQIQAWRKAQEPEQTIAEE